MCKFIISILLFSLGFSLDTDWQRYGNYEISLNSIIIEFKDNYAPSLGIESPLDFIKASNLKELDQFNNFKDLEPLFHSYDNFTQLHRDNNLHKYYRLTFNTPDANLLNLVSQIKNLSMVENVDFNYKMEAFLAPNDSYYLDQWALNNTGQAVSYNGGLVGTPGCDVDAERAWDVTTGNPNVVIAILDTGIDLDHPDLISELVAGYDFVNNDSTPNDGNMHGTACASIAAGTSNNGIGVAGVCWGCSLMPVKVLSDGGSGDFDDIVNGVIWASDNGANVISMSLGGGGFQSGFNNAVTYAHNNGTIVIAASGNDNGSISYPAAYEDCVAVGAMSPCNERKSPSSCDGENFWGSNYGNGLDFVAPGVRIHSATIGGYTSTFNGTSSACPHAAGVAGLIYSMAPGLSPDDVRAAMHATSVDIGGAGYDNQTGWGRINAFNAVSLFSAQPDAQVDVDHITVEASSNQMVFETINISNGLEGEVALEFSVLEEDYKWADSNGDIFESNWIELDNPTTIIFNDNDNAPEPINMLMDFPFDDRIFTQCTINPNGWIGLDGDSGAWDNAPLPTDEVPGAAIFGMWDDLNPTNNQCNQYCAGEVYYQQFTDKFVVTFDGVAHWWTNFENTFYTFQMVLNLDGRIELNYFNMVGEVNSATIGVQGDDVSEYVLVSFDNNYAENNLTTNILSKADWLTVSPLSGNLLPGTSQNINVDINTADLVEGFYYDIISIQTNDYNNYLFDIPVILNITDACGQWATGDVNNDGDFNVQDVIIILNIILDSSSYDECQIFASDLNADGQINVQDIILLVNIILS
jgi:subtilisin family serine protease